MRDVVTPVQVRAARGALQWSQGQLAKASGVARATIAEFEAGRRQPIQNNMDAVVGALERAGVVFLPADHVGPGIRMRTTATDTES